MIKKSSAQVLEQQKILLFQWPHATEIQACFRQIFAQLQNVFFLFSLFLFESDEIFT